MARSDNSMSVGDLLIEKIYDLRLGAYFLV